MKSAYELLRENFERWEVRGRGVLTFPEPVSPKPPFVPFPGHRLPQMTTGKDSIRPTKVSGFLQRAKELIRGENKATPDTATETLDALEEKEIEPKWMAEPPRWMELAVRLPPNSSIPRESITPLFASLCYSVDPLVFEIVGTENAVWMQWVVSEEDAPALSEQMQAHFPDVKLGKPASALSEMLAEAEDMTIVDFGLAEPFMLPLAGVKNDPFVTLVGALSSLLAGEIGLYQVILTPLSDPWAESGLAAVTKSDGKPFFDDGVHLAKAAQQKLHGSLYGVVVRLAAAGGDDERSWQIVRGMASALRHFAQSEGNYFVPLSNDNYDPKDHLADVLNRQTRRCGMVLNLEELAGLVHLPSASVQSKKFVRIDASTRAANATRREGVCLGSNEHAGEISEVWLPSEHRVRHCHILGGTGTGKSTLLFSMIQQDILNGEGIAVLDPHGDLIDRVLGVIPPDRVNDVVLFDPSDEEFIIPFNILSAHSDFEKQLLASDLVSVFQRLSTSWGDQMQVVLQNAVLAFLESKQGGTLADLRRFLLDAQWREAFLQSVGDADVRFYWKRAFPQLGGGRSIGPIITRLETFLSSKPVRYMVSQRENRLDFRAMMDSGKIFLARLPQGMIGRENAFLLGSLVMTKLQQMAMSRARVPNSQRRPFFCYIDEFQNFITPSLTEILSGARKYGLGLVLAHQELKQLDRDKEVGSAVLSNAFTRIVFRVGDADARALADGFAHFDARDIQSLGIGQAIARIERADNDFNLATTEPDSSDETEAEERRIVAIQASRSAYAIPLQQVQAELASRLVDEQEDDPQPAKPKKIKESIPAVAEVRPAQAPQIPAAQPDPEPPSEVPPATAIAQPVSASSPLVTDPGKGGYQHRILQDRIRSVGEQMGFHAHLEMPVGTSRESVDVGLIRPDMRIACEISVTTTIDHEVGNVRKCLRENFHLVAVITNEARRLRQIEGAVNGCFEPEEAARVRYFQPDAFLSFLSTLTPPPEPDQVPSAPAPKESVRKGYKVKRVFTQLTPDERNLRESAALKLLAEELKPPPAFK